MTRARPARARFTLARLTLARWFVASAWRAQRGRWLTAGAAVAVGIALATAIHTVNRSALAEFQQAIDVVNGAASLQVVARAGTLDDRVFETVLARAAAAGVDGVSPVLAVDTQVARPDAPGERAERLTVLGLDVFRAAQVTPALMPLPEPGDGGAGSSLLADDAVFLSPAAQAALGARPGQTITLRSGLTVATLRVAGGVAAGAGQRLAVMDLGAAQWRLGALGRLTRVDLRLAEGVAPAQAAAALRGDLPPEAEVALPEARAQRMSNLSRAYRVNLNVLALVALFTGAFLVFAAVGLASVRQRAQFALMAVLGADARWTRGVVLAQAGAVSLAGSVVGALAGLGLARALLGIFGGDLGGGYFPGVMPPMVVDAPVIVALVALGVAVGLAAGWLPAREAVSARPVEALRHGSAETALRRLAQPWAALGLLALAALLLALPPIDGLPIAAYAAIACILLAAIAAVPWLVATLFPVLLARAEARGLERPVAWLALARVAQSPGQAAGVIAGVVASFALTVAMVVMVASFRHAVADWLHVVLPADLYGRVPSNAVAGGIPPALRERIAALPGVARAEFTRTLELSLDAARPAVGLLARPLEANAPQARLPLTGPAIAPPPGAVAVYASEPAADLYRLAVGAEVALPLGSARFVVCGIYRDYARQHGAFTLALADYRRLTGDETVSDIALWVAPGTTPAAMLERLRAAEPALAGAEFRSADALRTLSLRIFDRSFALTYLLEAAALIVALFGVASSYAGQALARAREFGVLRHLGLGTRDLVRQVALEGGLLSAFGALWGAATGLVIGLVLIHRVNPQSFHWTMETRLPLGLIALGAAALALCGAIAAALAVRAATGAGPLAALKEDW
ncbi:MAG: ABC transporter permease [Burkholderiales bacterium]|nr:ABC transporter permease [Burkholderiales bacterium]